MAISCAVQSGVVILLRPPGYLAKHEVSAFFEANAKIEGWSASMPVCLSFEGKTDMVGPVLRLRGIA